MATPEELYQSLLEQEHAPESLDSALSHALGPEGVDEPADLVPDERRLLDLYIAARLELSRGDAPESTADFCWVCERAEAALQRLRESERELASLRANYDLLKASLAEHERTVRDLRRAAFRAGAD
jgi:hypothetical protein